MELAQVFPKTQAGFNNTVKPEVVAVKTSKEHSSTTVLLLT
jgi:hypothetical protein